MRESSLRLIVHVTGLLLVIFVIIHVSFILGWGRIISVVMKTGFYRISLGILLVISIIHSIMGVRRTILDLEGRSIILYSVILLVLLLGLFMFAVYAKGLLG